MKASESIANFQPKLREYTNFAVREIKNTCKQTGGRPAGSENEKSAIDYAKSKLKDFSHTVETEEFSINPKAFASREIVSGILLIISAASSFFGYYFTASTIFSFAIAIFTFFELVLHTKILDIFFKKSSSHNVYAKRNSSGETRRSIIISGNMDSPYERTFIRKGGKKLEKSIKTYAFCGLAYIFIFNMIVLLFPEKDFVSILKYIIIIFIPAFIALLFSVNLKKATEGANNNLTGAFTAIACMKFLSDNNIAFENTEVIALLTGGKTAGLKGSKEFFENYAKENKAENTVCIELDTIRDIEEITIRGTDANVIELLKNAALEAGVDNVLFSKSQALPSYSKMAAGAGVKAATLTAVDLSSSKHYYTREDTAQHLEPKAIEKGIFIALSAIFQFDEGKIS